ncbi:putative Zinc finger protein bud20 [Seiridium cardinale]
MGVGNKRTLTKTRRHIRDLDQVKADLLSPRHLSQWKDTKSSEDLPGLGKWYCIECAKWFEGEASLVLHRKGKPHKRRVKQLKEEAYTQKEAEAAVGLRTDNVGPARPSNPDTNEVDMAT